MTVSRKDHFVKSFLSQLRSSLKKDVFTDSDVEMVYAFETANSRYGKMKRELAGRSIIRIKRGVYLFAKEFQKYGASNFEIARYLYPPSYISLESALAHYSLIPEAVYTTTSVTSKRSCEFKTPLGIFSFSKLPPTSYQEGFVRLKTENAVFMIATPLKALLDKIYLDNRHYTSLAELESDLRVNMDLLQNAVKEMSNKEIVEYGKLYKSKRMEQLTDLILWEMK